MLLPPQPGNTPGMDGLTGSRQPRGQAFQGCRAVLGDGQIHLAGFDVRGHCNPAPTIIGSVTRAVCSPRALGTARIHSSIPKAPCRFGPCPNETFILPRQGSPFPAWFLTWHFRVTSCWRRGHGAGEDPPAGIPVKDSLWCHGHQLSASLTKSKIPRDQASDPAPTKNLGQELPPHLGSHILPKAGDGQQVSPQMLHSPCTETCTSAWASPAQLLPWQM